jgi:hypothetical protein
MLRTRRALASVLAVAAVLGAGAPAATAITPIFGGIPFGGVPGDFLGGATALSGACGTSAGQLDQGGTAGTITSVCAGTGLTFIGPQIGQIASVIGPTVISPAVVGNSIVVAAGNAKAG